VSGRGGGGAREVVEAREVPVAPDARDATATDAARRSARRLRFDRDPLGYQRARPPYPAEVFEILVREFGLGPGCRVLEIGAGTGQATGELLARGADVVAVSRVRVWPPSSPTGSGVTA